MRDVYTKLYKPGTPEILEMGYVRFYDATEPMVTEVHEHAYELTFVYSGHVYMNVGGNDYSLFGGNILCVAPNTSHDTGSFIQNKAIIYYIHLHPEAKSGNYGMNVAEVAELNRGLKKCANKNFVLSPKGCSYLLSLFEENTEPLSSAVARAKLVLFLREVLLAQTAQTSAAIPEDILQIVHYIRSNPEKMHSVAELASMVFLSLPRFKQKFKEFVGIPPAEFILRAKLDKAMNLLTENNTRITEVALALGFSTSQHFSVVFKRYFSISPTEFQKRSSKTEKMLFDALTLDRIPIVKSQ